MSERRVALLEILGALLVLGGIAAGYALVKDRHVEPIEAAFVGGVVVFGALLIAPSRVAAPLVSLLTAWKGTKP